ncbi:MAG: hypothetical protein Q8909_21190, partial [Bacteroidota bacterium]|nr:hypothetical protein [Bacteroidota bacterium]
KMLASLPNLDVFRNSGSIKISMNLSRNSLKLRFLGLISVIFVFAALANLPKAYASESVLLDTKTGNDYVQLIYPHYEFTPTVSGVLDSIDLAFSIKDPTLNFVATIEYPTFNPTDCVSDTILGTSGNPLDSNSIITHVVFQGAQCGLLAGHRYGIDFGALKANFIGGGVWGNATPGGNVMGGYGIYYGHPLPSCSDGVQNQNETGIDTGGICDASSALLDNLTGKGFAREVVPHWSFTPDKSGTLTSIAGYFSDQQIYGVRTMGAHLEDANGIGLDCNATDTVNLNPLRLHGILSGWNDFTGQDCHLTAGTGYRMRLDNVQTGGVWVSGLDSFIPNVFYGGIPDAPTCTSNCFSNVLFLPGVMGSRLYEESGSTEKELWVSSNDSNQSDLVLDNSGRSVNSEIYTKDDTQNNGEVDETGIVSDVYGFNMYKSFINDLRKWKNDDNIIADYAFIPYDWRLSLNDIITNGFVSSGNNLSYNKSQDFSESFILKKLEELQKSSRTGKVTIIAHSNGGLVAKALIQKLK